MSYLLCHQIISCANALGMSRCAGKHSFPSICCYSYVNIIKAKSVLRVPDQMP